MPNFHSILYDFFIQGFDLDRIASIHETSWYEVAAILDSEPAKQHMRAAIRVQRLREVSQNLTSRRFAMHTLQAVIQNRAATAVGEEGRRRAAAAILNGTKPPGRSVAASKRTNEKRSGGGDGSGSGSESGCISVPATLPRIDPPTATSSTPPAATPSLQPEKTVSTIPATATPIAAGAALSSSSAQPASVASVPDPDKVLARKPTIRQPAPRQSARRSTPSNPAQHSTNSHALPARTRRNLRQTPSHQNSS